MDFVGYLEIWNTVEKLQNNMLFKKHDHSCCLAGLQFFGVLDNHATQHPKADVRRAHR